MDEVTYDTWYVLDQEQCLYVDRKGNEQGITERKTE